MPRHRGDKATPYADVRALDRGLSLIEALADNGWSSPASLSAATGIDRGTIYRLLATMTRCGYVVRREEDGSHALSAKLKDIAAAIRVEDRLAEIVSPLLAELVERIFWPSDFAILEAGRLKIVASSHHLTSMTFSRRLVGKHRPILQSALGKAVLSRMTQDELSAALFAIRAAEPGSVGEDEAIERAIAETRAAGYASSDGLFDPKVSGIALPVMADGRVVGAVNVVFFRSAMTIEQAAALYLEPLRQVVAAVEQRLADTTV
jgi:IclR family mhp operon transcriptional activator